jgi:hypothetical protein
MGRFSFNLILLIFALTAAEAQTKETLAILPFTGG